MITVEADTDGIIKIRRVTDWPLVLGPRVLITVTFSLYLFPFHSVHCLSLIVIYLCELLLEAFHHDLSDVDARVGGLLGVLPDVVRFVAHVSLKHDAAVKRYERLLIQV